MPNNNDSDFSSSYAGRGCGCCAHCRCTGACGSIQDKSEPEQTISPTIIRQKTPVPTIPAVMHDKESVLNGPAYNKSLWSTLESLPHPNDLIMSKNSSRKEMLLSPEPLTPFMSSNNQQQQQSQTRNAIGMNRVPSSVALNNGQSSPPLPSLPKKEKKAEDSKSHKRNVNNDETITAFPGNKPSPRLPSRKGLPEGGLSIDVPKTKEGSQIDEEGHVKRSKSKQDINHSKHTKAKVRNLSRKSVSKKVESTEEESEEESVDRSKKKKHKEYVENDHEQMKLSHKSSKSLNRKSSQHWRKEQEQKIDSEEETVKLLPSKPKMCRKCSMNTLTKLKMSESEQDQQFGVNQTITPQLGTFSSPRFDQNAFQDREKVQEEILLQQLQRQRDREWEREQEREREQFAREIAQRAGGYNENGHGRKGKSSSKIHSPSIQRQSSKYSLNSGRKIISSSDNDDGSGEEESTENHEEEVTAKKHKKHHKRKPRSSRTSKKHHSETEEETSKDDEEEEVKARKGRKAKTSSKPKKYYETSPTSEDAEEVHQKQDDTSQEDEEEDVVEMKSSKKTKKKSKQNNESIPDIIKEEDEEKQPKQSPLKERSDNYSMAEPVNPNALDRNNLGPNVAEPQELKHTISIGNFSITRTRTVKPLKEFGSSPALRSLAKVEQEKEDDSSIELKRDKLKKILDSKTKTLNPKSSFAILSSSGPKSARENKLQNEALIIPRLRSMPSLSTLNATKKFIVQHAPASEPNTLYFIDMTQMDEYGNPFIAFRLHADPTSNQGSEIKLNKKGHDWLMQSHETGSKLKGRLWLSAGKDGPLLFVIDIKSRRVDKFFIQGAPNHLKKFSDSPNWGTHEDYRHLYCQSPEKKQLKWFVQEPGKLMRLFGRSEDDHGHVYAEARLANVSPSKKNRRTTKEAALCFYDPIKDNEKSNNSIPTQMDIGYLCCTWFCARQTYDEGQFAAAHAEVEMIENIEKAFEVDLLAGA